MADLGSETELESLNVLSRILEQCVAARRAAPGMYCILLPNVKLKYCITGNLHGSKFGGSVIG